MKKIAVGLCLLALVTGCDQKKTQAEVDLPTLGVKSVDAIYAAQNAYMQHGAQMTSSIVLELKNALNLWPNDTSEAGVYACRGALSLELERWIKQLNGTPERSASNYSDLMYECRQTINYKYDDNRLQNVWNELIDTK